MGIDDVVDELGESIAARLVTTRAIGGVAEDPRPHPPSESTDVVDQLFVKFSAVPVPDIGHQFVDLRGRQPKCFTVGQAHLRLAEATGLAEPVGVDTGDRKIEFSLG